ncbi:MAG: T9SS type A sorting domain-containing protein [Bacteroidota bacterium]
MISMVCSVASVYAQDKVWVGSVNSDWNTGANWSPVGAPSESSTVRIRPQGSNPYPVVTQNVTVEELVISDFSNGGTLTVSNAATLTIKDRLRINNEGTLILNGGNVTNEGAFNMGFTNAGIDISTGAFVAQNDVTINGTINGGNGSFTSEGEFTVSNNGTVNVENSTFVIEGSATINGTFNGNDGATTFENDLEVRSGGVINLGSGSLSMESETEIRSNGTANFGSGSVSIIGELDVRSSGFFNVQDAVVTVSAEAEFTSNGNLSIENGTLNVVGEASLSSGSTFDLGNGNLNIDGDVEFLGGSTVNAGTSTIQVTGDLELANSNFNADSSTVVFSGDGDQEIDGTITFYNLTVETDGALLSGGDITVTNDAAVQNGSEINMQGNDQLEVQGQFDNEGTVNNTRPFVEEVTVNSGTSITLLFDTDMENTSVENVSNYALDNSISITAATQNTGNLREVTLTVSALTNGIEYTLTINNVRNTGGTQIADNHIQRFTPSTTVTYFSRRNGNWNTPNTWSTVSHTGPAASDIPTTTTGNRVRIDDLVTITTPIDADRVESIVVDVNGRFRINRDGILDLGTKVITGPGQFIVNSRGQILITSADGISASSPTGNIQTATRTFNTNGLYDYIGDVPQVTGDGLPEQVRILTIDNTAGVTLTKNLRASNTLQLENGILTVPPGLNLIANNKSISNGSLILQQELTGTTGWRLLSSPVSTTYGDLLDSVVTQGFAGSQLGNTASDSLQPNILFYDETFPGTDNQRWRAPVNANDTIPAGQGIFAFVFGSIPTDNRYNQPLPVTLTAFGQEHDGDANRIEYDVTFTASADSGWNLVGNPYASSIDWDHPSWRKTRMDNTIYVWDTATSQYKTWNGTTGDLTDGIIAPFQGFWVKANAANPRLRISENAKVFGDVFVGKTANAPIPSLSLVLTNGQEATSTHFMFSDSASIAKDAKDAFRLLPPPGIGTYLEAGSVLDDGTLLSINNLPRRFGIPIAIPLSFKAFNTGTASFTPLSLEWDELKNIPRGWTISLIDNDTGTHIPLKSEGSYTYEPRRGKLLKAPNAERSSGARLTQKSVINKRNARFLLLIDPGEDGTELPQQTRLEQNYPNPFNPTTTIQFEIPLQDIVQLTVFDITGRYVKQIVDTELSAGIHRIPFDGSDLASGLYIYQLRTSQGVYAQKMMLIK